MRKSNSTTGGFPNGDSLSPRPLHKRVGEELDITSVDINMGKTASSYNLKWSQHSTGGESPAPSPTVSLTYLQSEV